MLKRAFEILQSVEEFIETNPPLTFSDAFIVGIERRFHVSVRLHELPGSSWECEILEIHEIAGRSIYPDESGTVLSFSLIDVDFATAMIALHDRAAHYVDRNMPLER